MRMLTILLAAGSLLLASGFTPTAAVGDDEAAPSCCRRQADDGGCCGGCGRGAGRGMGYGYRGGRGPAAGGAAGSGMGGPGMAEAHGPIHALLDESGEICREVQDIEGGVYSRTSSDDPEVTAQIRLHVAQMKERLETGAGLRHWDPLFVELFRNHDKITMRIRDIEGGVEVWETSDDPEVAALIRQHARRAVSEFVAEGYDRVHEPTPLPGSDTP